MQDSFFEYRKEEELTLANDWPIELCVCLMLSGSQDIIPLLKPVSELKARYVVQRSPVDALIPRVALDPPHWSRRNLLLNIKVRSATAVNMTFWRGCVEHASKF